jgi:pimeloyl-ACP methyl ester carboxylesterase
MIQIIAEHMAWSKQECLKRDSEEYALTNLDVAYRVLKPSGCEPSRAVIYSYGSLQTMCGSVQTRCQTLAERFNVAFVVWDVPGYGHSKGEPTEKSVCEAVASVYNAVSPRFPGGVYVWGWSLGSVPACHLASAFEVKGVVLESPIASAIHVRWPTCPLDDLLGCFPLCNLRRVPSFAERCKVLITHMPERDETVLPVQNSTRLKDALLAAELHVEVKEYEHREFVDENGERFVTEHGCLPPYTWCELLVPRDFFL